MELSGDRRTTDLCFLGQRPDAPARGGSGNAPLSPSAEREGDPGDIGVDVFWRPVNYH
jgi:hypothetical protein